MSNPWKDYLQNFRDNLPAGVTYRGDIARYVFNDKRFILPNDVVRYKNYLEKLGFVSDAAAEIAATLFSNDEPGFFIDADDWSTLFTDTAGTTPVTAPNQGVALALDKSGNDNHATQATTSARPLTARHPDGGVRNLLDHTEDFGDSAWSKSGTPATVTDQGNGVWRLQAPASVWELLQTTPTTAAGTVGSFAVDIKDNSGGTANALQILLYSNIIEPVTATDEWVRYHITGSNTFTANRLTGFFHDTEKAVDVLIRFPQLELGSEATPYQRRVNLLDVSEAGKRSIRRLYFNGTSHFMESPAQMGNKNELSTFIGYRSDVRADANGYVFTSAGNTSARSSQGASFISLSGNTESYTVGGEINDLPRIVGADRVFSSSGSKTTGDLTFGFEGNRQAGSAGVRSTDDVTRIGAREGGVFFVGFLDQLILRGALTDEATIEKTEKYVSTKSPEVETL